MFAQDQFGEVKREAVGIVKHKRMSAVQHVLSGCFCFFYFFVEHSDTGFECTQECVFFFPDHFADQFLLSNEFGVCRPHGVDQCRKELVHECFAPVEERISVTHGTPEYTADDIAGFGIRRQLPVGYREGDGADMVGDDTHRYVFFLIGSIRCRRHIGNSSDDGLEDVGVVVRGLSLQGHAEPLKAHPRVDHMVRERFERAVGFAVILHEYEVPYLDDERMVSVDECSSGRCPALGLGAQVDMDFGAGATRAGIAHFPEVVVFVSFQDMVLWQKPFPVLCRFIVAVDVFGRTAFKDRHVEPFRIEVQTIYKIFPCPSDDFFLEIIAERPVSEHLEHGMMIGIMSHLFQVVMFPADAQTFLRIRHTGIFNRYIAENDIFELIHPGIGKHQGRVAFDHHRSRGYDVMSF